MLGVLVNVLTVVVGGSLGLLLKRGIPKKVSGAAMAAIGLCTLLIGMDGALEGGNILVAIVSLVGGVIIGTLLNIDGKLQWLGDRLERAMGKSGEGSIARGFVTASLLFCVGAMTIVGSLESGLTGDHSLIFTKSTLDFISSMMLASTLGVGVVLAGSFVLVVQGALVLLAGVLAPVLSEAVITEITCVGSLMIVGLGLNLLNITKLKIADFLPALLLAPLVSWLGVWLGKLTALLG